MRFITAFGYFRVADMYQDVTKDNKIVTNSLHNFEQGDILILEGGTDIDTIIYNKPRERYTSTPDKNRDKIEIELFQKAVAANVPILGICRGAQLSCALSGGSLIQHIDNHTSSHKVKTNLGENYWTSSCHHQAMIIDDTKHELLAWCEFDKIPEVVFFKDTKSLAIQGHPEFMNQEDAFVKYTVDLVKEFLCPQ